MVMSLCRFQEWSAVRGSITSRLGDCAQCTVCFITSCVESSQSLLTGATAPRLEGCEWCALHPVVSTADFTLGNHGIETGGLWVMCVTPCGVYSWLYFGKPRYWDWRVVSDVPYTLCCLQLTLLWETTVLRLEGCEWCALYLVLFTADFTLGNHSIETGGLWVMCLIPCGVYSWLRETTVLRLEGCEWCTLYLVVSTADFT